MSLYAPFLRCSEILVENRRFEPTPPLGAYLAPPLEVFSLEFRQDFWRPKIRVHELSYGIVRMILGLAIFVELRLVTDRRTDWHTMTAYTALA